VLLGYDEQFVGLTTEQLRGQRRRLPFMQHDRATLAGVMIALGALYRGLAHDGLVRWEWAAVTSSRCSRLRQLPPLPRLRLLRPAALRADGRAAAAVLATLVKRPPKQIPHTTDLHNDETWLRAQRGQLLLVSAALGITAAGLGIATIGIGQRLRRSRPRRSSRARGRARSHRPAADQPDRPRPRGFGGALAAAGLAC
jgi:hypothetical protein